MKKSMQSLHRGSMVLRLVGLLTTCFLVGCSTYSREANPKEAQLAEQYIAQGILNLRAGKLDRAEAAFEAAYEVQPGAAALDGAGCVYWARKDKKKAVEYFNAAISIEPEYAAAYSHLGLAFEEMGDTKKAEEYYVEAIRLDPTQGKARNNYAAFLMDKGARVAAISELRKANVVEEDETIQMNLKSAEQSGKSDY